MFSKSKEKAFFQKKNDLDESKLIQKVKDKDVKAFKELYQKYKGKIYALTLRLSGDKIKAEDLLQDIFIRLWEKIDKFEEKSSFYTWFYKLALNYILNDKRINKKKIDNEINFDDISKTYYKYQDYSIETLIDLEKAILSLPDSARKILILHDIEKYKHEEIANLMGISTGTSKAQLHRARKIIKEVIKK